MSQINNQFEAIINQIKRDNSKELEEISLLDYVKLNIRMNEYFFFIANTDEEVSELNTQFINYLSGE